MRTRVLTITLAAVLALLGVVAILAYVRQANERAVNGLKAETVMVAKDAIPAGTSLSKAQQENLLSTEKVPDSSLTTAAVQSVTAANEDLVVSGTVAPGQVLLGNMLESSTAVTAGSAAPPITIPQGKVAVTVQMCATEAIANYLTSGAEVMVFATAPTSSSSTVEQQCSVEHAAVPPGGATTELMMSNITVLSVTDALPTSSSTSSSTSSGSSTAVADPESQSLSAGAVAVTLLVTPTQAAQLIQVDQVDLPYLALQSTG